MPLMKTMRYVLFLLFGAALLSSCSATSRERREEKRERKEWKDDGKSRWQKMVEWEERKSKERWEKFKQR